MTFRITTVSKMRLDKAKPGIMALDSMTLGIITFRITRHYDF